MFKEIPIGEVVKENKKLSLEDFEKYRIRHTDTFKDPDIVFSIGGAMVATRKNIFGITGKAGAGKTYTISLIIAAVLKKGEFQGVISSYLPKGKDKIILFDTEQSEFHISVVLNRIKKLGATDKQMENLITYSFDTIRSSLRREYFEQILMQTDGVGLVIIDGIADLVMSVNDEQEASNMFDDLRALATKLDVAIGYVLHQNPSDNIKMRGHLGTIGNNKSESVLQTSSTAEDESIKLITFSKSRNKKAPEWSFRILEDGIPEIMQECYEEPKLGRKKAKELNDIERYSLLNIVYSTIKADEGLQSNILVERIRCAYIDTHGETSVRKIEDFVKYCKEMHWLVSDGHKKPFFLYPFKPS